MFPTLDNELKDNLTVQKDSLKYWEMIARMMANNTASTFPTTQSVTNHEYVNQCTRYKRIQSYWVRVDEKTYKEVRHPPAQQTGIEVSALACLQ